MRGARPRRPGTPLRGRYLVHNPIWNAWLRVVDLVLDRVIGKTAPAAPRTPPSRILVAVGGHLGDAVIATSFISRLHEVTGADIGVVTGSWNRRVLEGHPRIRHLHTFDHWKLDRSGGFFVTRWLRSRRTRRHALADIRMRRYDASIALSPYYPNFAPMLWRAKIPMRVGFTSAGFGPLQTHAVTWEEGHHIARDHLRLLEAMMSTTADVGDPRYVLDKIPETARIAARQILGTHGVPGDYVVVHMGSGAELKEWPVTAWRRVAERLLEGGMAVVFTGAGARQRAMADSVRRGLQRAVNLCDGLDWPQFRAVIAGARAVLSVDTVAMHVAAAEGTPTVSLVTGIDAASRWQPLSDRSVTLTHPVPCAPCYRSRGCAEMTCVREISPETVLNAVADVLR